MPSTVRVLVELWNAHGRVHNTQIARSRPAVWLQSCLGLRGRLALASDGSRPGCHAAHWSEIAENLPIELKLLPWRVGPLWEGIAPMFPSFGWVRHLLLPREWGSRGLGSGEKQGHASVDRVCERNSPSEHERVQDRRGELRQA